MNQRIVSQLERELEDRIADALHQLEAHLPLSASRQTIHLMAKAAVTVYEAAVEASESNGQR